MKLNKKNTLIFLAIILLIGSFLRLWQLDSSPPGLYHDEAMNGNNALEVLETGEYKWFYPENNGREGLYINIVALSLKTFGNKPWAIRLISALFGILTILGLFLLSREFFNSQVVLFSSFFLATSFWHILFSRIGFRGIMAPFFLVWAVALFFMASRKKSWKLAALGGLSFGLGFHTYIAFRIAPLLLLAPVIKAWRHKQKEVVIAFLTATLIAGLPLGIYFLKNPEDFFGRTSQVSIFSSEKAWQNLALNSIKTFGMLFFVGDGNWRHNFAGSPQLWWPVALLFLIGLISALYKITHYTKCKLQTYTYRTRKLKFLISAARLIPCALGPLFGSIEGFLILWLIIMSLPVVVSNEGVPHALRSIILIPPIMILAGIGLDKLVKKTGRWIKAQIKGYPEHKKQILRIRKKLIGMLFVSLFLVAAFSFVQYFIRWTSYIYTYHAFNGRSWDIGSHLETLPPETNKYVIINASGVLVKNIPMPAQTIMFATDTYLESAQKEENITYILPEELGTIKCPEQCAIVALENDAPMREKIKEQISGLTLSIKPGFEILTK